MVGAEDCCQDTFCERPLRRAAVGRVGEVLGKPVGGAVPRSLPVAVRWAAGCGRNQAAGRGAGQAADQARDHYRGHPGERAIPGPESLKSGCVEEVRCELVLKCLVVGSRWTSGEEGEVSRAGAGQGACAGTSGRRPGRTGSAGGLRKATESGSQEELRGDLIRGYDGCNVLGHKLSPWCGDPASSSGDCEIDPVSHAVLCQSCSPPGARAGLPRGVCALWREMFEHQCNPPGAIFYQLWNVGRMMDMRSAPKYDPDPGSSALQSDGCKILSSLKP